MLKTISWFVMAVFALGISAYAISLLAIPGSRPPFLHRMFQEVPVTAWVHFVCSAAALTLGVFQVNGWLRGRFPAAHRLCGKMYVLAVMAGGVAGFVLALRSMGGMIAHAGFGIMAVAWLGSTLRAYLCARAGNLPAHRDWMMRSYALTFAAVTLRMYIPVSIISGLPFLPAYQVISWLAWVPNLLIIEWYIRLRRRSGR